MIVRPGVPVLVLVALAQPMFVGTHDLQASSVQQPGARPGELIPPGRDRTSADREPTAIVRGRVVDSTSGQPLRRVTVSVRDVGRLGEPRSTATDDRGRYELGRLPAGNLVLSAAKPGYVTKNLGQRTTRDVPRPLAVRQGEVVEHADFALERGGVLTGRVVDEAGEQILNAQVTAYRPTWSRGKRRLIPAASGSTNDLGVYRIFGLAPGPYLVKGETRLRVGGSESGVREYASTFFPGTTFEASAQPVVVLVDQESTADFALGLSAPATVSGIVLTSAGRPATSGAVRAVRVTGSDSVVFSSDQTSSIGADGAFSIKGLMPGSWIVTAATSVPSGRSEDDPPVRESASLVIEVAGEDQAVTLTASGGGTIRGRVVFDAAPPPAGASEVQLRLRPLNDGTGSRCGTFTMLPAGRFEALGVSGRCVVEVSRAPRGWFIRRVRYGDDDVLDSGVEVSTERPAAEIEVMMSDRVAAISGTAIDGRGGIGGDYTVVAISEDSDKWFLPSGRHLKTARPNQDGTFTLENLAPGEYRVVAGLDLDPEWIEEPEQVERLRLLGELVAVQDGKTKLVKLSVRSVGLGAKLP